MDPPPAKKRKKKKSYAGLVVLLVLVLLLAGLAGGVTYLATQVRQIDTVFPGVTVNGVYAEGMSRDSLRTALENQVLDAYDGFSVTLDLPMEHSITVTAEDAGLAVSCEEAARQAWEYGRDENLYLNLYNYESCRYLGGGAELTVEPEITLSSEAVRALVTDVAAELNEELLQSEMKVGQYSVNVVKGAHAFYVDEDTICEVLEDAILTADPTPILYLEDMRTDEEMDLDSLYEEITCEAVSAVYDPELGGATESRVGVTFDLKDAKARWAAAEYGETVAIPLIITEPEVYAEDINNMIFRDLLGERTTSLAGSTMNRISNVKKACELLSAVILQPGEQFDYNSCLGERTWDNGWLPAPAYADGEVVDELGGGICQVSSTLFVSSLLADLQIDTRTCHYFPVGYLTAGMDATVSWGGPEFRFTNNREYPVRLRAFVSSDNRFVTVQIWGTNLDGSYVKINFSGPMEVFNDETLRDANGNPVATGYRATIWCHLMNADGSIREGAGGDYHWFLSEYHYHTEDIMAKVVNTGGGEGEE